MKSFIVSLCVLILIIALTILNTYHFNNIASTMISKVTELTIDDIDKINDLNAYFESKLFLISLSCSDKETDKIQESIIILKSKIENKDSINFNERKNLLIKYITQIQEHETLSFRNIL